MAILIADLSGYTALTEAHGAAAAADVVERYVEIVRDCLAGNTVLHERTGDEVLILSTSAEDLLATGLMLLQTIREENNFLLLHGGLHYGNLLYRNNNYFGTAVNLASRIAATAAPGSLWCSQDFITALKEDKSTGFSSKGTFKLKNVQKDLDLFALDVPEHKFHIDPVCRMLVLDTENALVHPQAPGRYFCSDHCLNTFISVKNDGLITEIKKEA
jgi:adenylate cyclase